MDTSRRDFLRYGLAGTTLSVAAARSGTPGASQAATGAAAGHGRGVRLRPFLEPLPVPGDGIVVATPAAPGAYHFTLPRRHRPDPFATGPMLPPTPDERGFKGTTKVNPGTFTIVRGRIELPAGVQAPQSYVYHCHIVEHEDNDMMQSFTVLPR